MSITKAQIIGDKDHNKYLEESQQLGTIFSGQLLALLLMDGCNIPTALWYRNKHDLCGVFNNSICGFFGDELLIWFGRLDCTLRKLGGFYVSFAVSENARLPLEKQPFV